MLKINLLPEQQRAKISNVEKELTLYVLMLILVGLCLGLLHGWSTGKINQLKTKKQAKIVLRQKLVSKVKQFNKLKKEMSEIKTNIEVIKQIRGRQGLAVHYLDELVTYLPKDKMWFESLQLNANGQIFLRGIALDNQIVANYIERLRRSKYVSGVYLRQTSKRNINGLGLISFQFDIRTRPAKNGATHG